MKTQKSLVILAALLVLLGIQLSLAVSKSSALDNPHNSNNGVSCADCHDATKAATYPDWWTDQQTNVCGQCHQGGMADAVYTHRDKNGNVLVQCTQCHDPHSQIQERTWRTTDTFYQFTGVSTAVTSATLQMTGAGWTTNQWLRTGPTGSLRGYILLPDIRYPAFNYRIIGNTADTITISTAGGDAINLSYIKPNATFAITLGMLVKDNVNGSNVKFFRETGSKSFADGDAVIDGICQVCHTATSYFNTQGVLDAGGTGSHPSVIATGQKCVECHNHTGGFKPACNSCHGSPPVDAATLITKDMNNNSVTSDSSGPGAHNKHVNSKGYTCEICHTGGMLSGATQGDNKINIGLTFGGANIGGTYDAQVRTTFPLAAAGTTTVTFGGTQQCSSVYCHSSGQSADGLSATPVYGAPRWNTPSTGACGACHKTTTGTTLGRIDTGSHTPHLTSTITIQCEDCHTGAGNGTSYTSGNHVNQLIDVADSYTKGGTPGNGYGTCSVAACHGKGTPTWGATFAGAGTDQCTKCHGTPTVGATGTSGANMAPPNDTASNPSGTTVGAHQAHLTANAVGRVLKCDECHTVPAQVNSAGHIQDSTPGAAEVLFSLVTSTYANANSATPQYTPGTTSGTCATIYCHGSNMPKGSTEGANRTPSWTDANYLNGTASHDCAQCHGYPPSTIGAHAGKGPADCNSCHKDVDTNGQTFLIVSQHVDGILQVSGCNGCHGQSGATGAPLVAGDLLSGPSYSPTGHTVGMHPMHVTTLNYTCSTCHDQHNMPTLDSKITMSFSGTLASGGVYTGTALNTPYSYNAGVSNAGPAQTCAVYCHGSSMAPNGGTDTTPEWTNSATGQCGTCHGATAANPPQRGAHVKHAGATNLNLSCDKCHGVTDELTHMNGSVSWSLATGDVRFSSSATYSSSASGASASHAPSAAYSTCAVACHTKDGATLGSGITGNPNWGATNSAGCAYCHNKAGDASPVWSTPHTKHINDYSANTQFTCNACHAGTAQNNTTLVTGSTNSHVNASKDVIYNSWVASNGTYTAGQGCQNTYCHSNGTNIAAAPYVTAGTQSWTGTTTCGSCHGDANGRPNYTSGAPKANSHMLSKHSSLTCDKCHNGTTTTGNTITDTTKHINKNYDLLGSGATYTFSYSYLSNGGTCATSYCHGTPAIKWGTTGSLTCSSCHTSMDAGGTTAYTGKHQTHVSTYGFSCEMCHSQNNGTVHVNGEVVAGTQSAEVTFRNLGTSWATGSYNNSTTATYRYRSLTTNPYNGELVVSPTPTYTSAGTVQTDGGLKWRDSGSCQNMWCHSNASPVNGVNSYPTVTWGATMNCGSCHSKAGDASPTWSAPHNKHITSYSANTNVGTCVACHSGTATSNTAVITGSTSSHVNAKKDLIYASWVASNGTYTTGQGCQNTYCHSNGTNIAAAPYSAGTQSWQGTTACTSCHTGGTTTGPTYANNTPKKNSHQAHVVTQAYVCVDCHSNTVNASNAITSFTNHVNKSYDVNGSTFSAVSYTYNVAGSTCATKCHGSSSSPKWGSNYATSDSCTKCHGTVTTGAQGSVMTNVTGSTYPWSAKAYLAAPSTTANSTGLFSDLSNTQVGAHQEHLTTTPYRGPIACAECHQVPSQPVSAGHMSGLPATVQFQPALSSYLANTHESAATPNSTYTAANATCSTTYCHDSSYFKNGWSAVTGTVPQPIWSNTSMLNQTTPTTTDCGKCHGYPPDTTAGKHPNNMTCSSCHPHVSAVDNITFVDISKHMNGKVEGGGCNGCHWFDTNEVGAWSNVRSGADAALTNTTAAFGAHGKHIDYLKSLNGIATLDPGTTAYGTGNFNLVCGVCHDQNKLTNHKPDAGAVASTRNVDFGFSGNTLHQFGSSPTLTYNFNTTTQTGTRSCSNLDCHYKTTPVW